MSIFKIRIAAVSVLVCAVVLLPAGCKKREEPRGRTGSILYFSFLGGSSSQGTDGPLVKNFGEETGTAVTRNAVMPADVLTRKKGYLSGTQTPDVITWIKTGEDSELAGENLFLDLGELWKEEGWLQEFPPALAGACRAGNVAYMVPFAADTWKIYYRKSLFAAHAVDVPRSWEDFLHTCKVLRDAGISPVSVGAKFRWPASLWLEYINIRLNGSSFHHDLLRGTIPFHREKMEKTLRSFAKLVEMGVFIPDSMELSWASALRAFLEEEGAMYLFNDSILNSLPPEVESDLGSFPFPLILPQAPLTQLGTVQGWVVPRSAQNTDGALQFLRFCGSESGREGLESFPAAGLLEGGDTILPELNRLARPVLRGAFLDGTEALLRDPSEKSISLVLNLMEQAWISP